MKNLALNRIVHLSHLLLQVYGGIGRMAQEFLNEVSVFAHDHMTVYSRFDVVNGLK